LIMGIDKRPGEVGTGFNTDTLILASINPVTKSIGMLSVPRDIVVPLPGQETMQHINTAYAIGELQQPGNGPKFAMQTVQYNFGMPVNSYIVLSFDAVTSFVDDIGGVDIDVTTTINDPEYPDMNNGFDPLYIPAGRIHMDGKLALKYARTRHQDTDFERTRRQQQVIMAVRQKALTPEVLTQLAGQAPTIWNQVSKGVLTNISFDQAVSLGLYVKDIPTASIQRATVEDKYVQAVQYNGDSVLTPNRTVIGQLMAQVFGPDYNK
jgi:LCP family protein required for cell wall assembly